MIQCKRNVTNKYNNIEILIIQSHGAPRLLLQSPRGAQFKNRWFMR